MEYGVIGAVALAIALALAMIVGRQGLRREHKTPPGAPAARREPCPLCGAPLARGERVKSAVFPGQRDRLTHVFGCPHCYPPNTRFPRSCPVCRASLAPDAFVTGRFWERMASGNASPRPRSHLHLLGCEACRRAQGAAGLKAEP
jgi:hypothetical protein